MFKAFGTAVHFSPKSHVSIHAKFHCTRCTAQIKKVKKILAKKEVKNKAESNLS